MFKQLIAIVISFTFICFAQSVNQMTWLTPTPNGYPIRYIQYVDSSTIVASGLGGYFMRSTDGGETYRTTVGAAPNNLSGSNQLINTGYFFDRNNGLLAGVGGFTKTTDGGLTFNKLAPGNDPIGSYAVLNMKFATPLIGYAVGTFPYLAVTSDGGNSWLANGSIVSGGWKLGIKAISANRIIVVGDYVNGSNVHISTDAGNSWSDYAAGTGFAWCVDFSDSLTGYIGGSGSGYKTTDGGVTWSQLPFSAGSTVMTKVICRGNTVTFIGSARYLYQSTDGGATFAQIDFTSPSQHGLGFSTQTIDQLGSRMVMGAGAGLIYRSSDNGLTWTTKSSILKSGYMNGLWANSTGRIISAGGANATGFGQFMISTDWGNSWMLRNSATDPGMTMKELTMLNDQVGYASAYVGGGLIKPVSIYKTTNGGLSWDSVGTTGNNNGIRWMDFGNEDIGIVLCNNFYSFKTLDGGKTWQQIHFPYEPVATIRFIDSVTYFVSSTGNNMISKTTDGGVTWTNFSITFPTYTPANNIRMLNRNFGIIVGPGWIFRTTNSGTTWDALPTNPNVTIYDVAIRDTMNYVISGTSGLLMQTTNGGVTWSNIQTACSGELQRIALSHHDTLLISYTEANSASSIVKIALAPGVQPASVRLTAPNGGEIYRIGSQQNITWNSTTISQIKIEYSTNDGSSWNNIVSPINANLGFYTWTIPQTPSTQCRVRISDYNNPNLFDLSDNVFTIDVPPTSFWVPLNTAGTITDNIWGADMASSNVIWLCTYGGNIYRSIDGGATLTSVGSLGYGTYNIAAISDQIACVATSPSSGDGKIFRTTDGGTTWTQVYTTAGAWFNLIAKIDATHLWAQSDPINGYYHIVKSNDAGATWSVAQNLPAAPANGYGAVGGWDQIGNTLWFAAGGLAGVTTTNKVYKSTNGPDGPWTVSTTTLPNPAALSFSSPTGIGLTGFWDVAATMNKTTNGGNTWTEISTTTPAAHTMAYVRGTSTAYLASTQGLYKTTNNGATWGLEPLPIGVYGEPFLVRLYNNGADGITVGAQGFILKKVNATSVTALALTAPNGGEHLSQGSSFNITWLNYSPNLNTIKIQLSTDNGSSWSTVAPSVLAANNSYSWTVPSITTVQARIKISSTADSTINDISDTTFTIGSPNIYKDVSVSNGWNIISVPVTAASMQVDSLFQGGYVTSPAYGYNNGYVSTPTLSTGLGYWLRFNAAHTFSIYGGQIVTQQVPLAAGWNLIGPFATDAPVAGITTTPAGIINSPFYGYNNGYIQPTTLSFGKGYWVRTSAAGIMNLNVAEAKNPIALWHPENNAGKINITDAAGNTMTLYSVSAIQNACDLPPVPPTGIFDVRYASDRYAEVLSGGQEIHIAGASYPLTVRVENATVTLVDKATNGKLLSQTLTPGSSLQITNPAITSVIATSSLKPTVYALNQNYPNPFNPATVISYQLPKESWVTLKVFDVLGAEVATLVDALQAAETYQITFDASHIPTGIYFYTLKAGNFVSTKKMMLLK